MIQSVTVSVRDLKKTVSENRKKHIETYNKACEGYLEAIKDYTYSLSQKVSMCKTTKEVNEAWASLERPDAPLEYTNEYDHAIALLDYETRDTILLDALTFSQLVQDKWSWKAGFDHVSTSNIQYGASKQLK